MSFHKPDNYSLKKIACYLVNKQSGFSPRGNNFPHSHRYLRNIKKVLTIETKPKLSSSHILISEQEEMTPPWYVDSLAKN